MKILLAAPQDETVLGTITGYCKKALERLGSCVEIFDFRNRPYSKNKFISGLKSIIRPFLPSLPSPYDLPAIKSSTDQRINRTLLDLVQAYRPDVLLVLCGENILPQTIIKISKELRVVTVNWFYDSLLSPLRQDFLRNVIPFYDYIFIVDSLNVLKHVDIKARFVGTLALACDPDVHRHMNLSPQEFKRYDSDVVFVGTVTPEREKMLESLVEFNLKIWGCWQRRSWRLRGCYQKQHVYGEEAVKIYNASKIVIDMHSLYGVEKEIFNITPRLFEVPASGAFLLTNYVPQIHDFYKIGEEIVTYKDIEDLKYLIKYYLEHDEERVAIAERAYQRAHQQHTYLERLKVLLASIKKI